MLERIPERSLRRYVSNRRVVVAAAAVASGQAGGGRRDNASSTRHLNPSPPSVATSGADSKTTMQDDATDPKPLQEEKETTTKTTTRTPSTVSSVPEFVVCDRCKRCVELPKCVRSKSLLSGPWTCAMRLWNVSSENDASSCYPPSFPCTGEDNDADVATCTNSGGHIKKDATASTALGLRPSNLVHGAQQLLVLEAALHRFVWGEDVGVVLECGGGDATGKAGHAVSFSSSHSSATATAALSVRLEHRAWKRVRGLWRSYVANARTYARLTLLLDLLRRACIPTLLPDDYRTRRRRKKTMERVQRMFAKAFHRTHDSVEGDEDAEGGCLEGGVGQRRHANKKISSSSSRNVPLPIVPMALPEALQHRKSFETAFYELHPYMADREPPLIGGQRMDFFKVFHEVAKRGGSREVKHRRMWTDVTLTLGYYISNASSFAWQLKNHYLRYLAELEPDVVPVEQTTTGAIEAGGYNDARASRDDGTTTTTTTTTPTVSSSWGRNYSRTYADGSVVYASNRKRSRCHECVGCLQTDDCGECKNCLDKPKYGGANKLKQCCIMRKCQHLKLIHVTGGGVANKDEGGRSRTKKRKKKINGSGGCAGPRLSTWTTSSTPNFRIVLSRPRAVGRYNNIMTPVRGHSNGGTSYTKTTKRKKRAAEASPSFESSLGATGIIGKRKRGRPRKYPGASPALHLHRSKSPATTASSECGGSRRPRKAQRRSLGPSQEEEEEDNDFCNICHDGGVLLECETEGCTFTAHLSCVGLKKIPNDEWHCPRHLPTSRGEAETGKEEGSEGLLTCVYCPSRFSRGRQGRGRGRSRRRRGDDDNDDSLPHVCPSCTTPYSERARLLRYALNRATSLPYATPFVGEVSRAEFPEYLDIITNPIDLGKMLAKVQNGEYASVRSFLKDVDLLVSNSEIFCRDRFSHIIEDAYKVREALLECVEGSGEDANKHAIAQFRAAYAEFA